MSGNSEADSPVAVRPGAPGQASRTVDVDDISDTAALPITAADVSFMQGMIGHHAQALDMTALIADRTNARDLSLLGKRISVSQEAEIGLMQKWLRDHGQEIPEATAAHMVHGDHTMMPGMLTASQMQQLTDARGVEFERLFLEFMIQHHAGAITMVEELFTTTGAGQDTYVFRFATDVDVDQRMEIARMQDMLAGRVPPGGE